MKCIPHLLFVFCLVASGKISGQRQVAPNIIFIVVDDQGYGDLGSFFQQQRKAKPREFTPNLDAMAAGGAMLTHNYAAAPVCAPSRASMMLGVSQGHANVRNNQFDKALEDNYTMASTLRQLGYSTAAIGKWGLQGLKNTDSSNTDWPAHPLKRGFDYFFGYMRHADGHEHYPKEGLYRGKKEVWMNHTNIAAGLDKCYTADLWIAAAKHYIMEQAKAKGKHKPFFIFLAFDTPHAVLELPTGKYPAGGGLKGGIQWIGRNGQWINTAEGTIDSWRYPEYANATYDDDNNPATPQLPWPDTYKRYATANRRIDDGVGDIRQLLKDLKIDDNTVIVYTSDNGPSIESYLPKEYAPNLPTFFDSYGPFDGIKRDTWEGGLRMPSIISWPGHIAAGKKITTPNASYDFASTFLGFANAPAPARMDGVSLAPALSGNGKQPESNVYIEYVEEGRTPDFKQFAPAHRNRQRNQMQALRIGDYTGVRYNIKSASDSFEIYNVVKDPGQRVNLAQTADAALMQGNTEGIGFGNLQKAFHDRALQNRRPDAEAPRPYDDEPVPAITGAVKNAGALKWSFYSGRYPWLPQTAMLHAAKTGTVAILENMKQLKLADGVVTVTGYINVPETRKYTFRLTTGSKALLRLHGATLIDADCGYVAGTDKTADMILEKGMHPFALTYKVVNGEGVSLKWE